jgi:Arc/MetJ-type ribon-helix-helix transcriptional regulator
MTVLFRAEVLMHANAIAPTITRRRRSAGEDPLKKITLQMSESVVAAIKSLVDKGEAPSANVLVEDAVRTMLGERRRAEVYAAYHEAAKDSVFMKDMNEVTAEFDVAIGDGMEND